MRRANKSKRPQKNHLLGIVAKMPDGLERLWEIMGSCSLGAEAENSDSKSISKGRTSFDFRRGYFSFRYGVRKINTVRVGSSSQRQNDIRYCSQIINHRDGRSIFVLEQGRIAEEGTHQDLLSAKGAYAKLHQADDWKPKQSGSSSRIFEDDSKRIISRDSPSLPIESSKIVNAWYSNAWWLYLLRPFEAFYRATLPLRKIYLRLRSNWSSQVPVIVVGNLTVGGTGKTPFVVSLVKHLKNIGYSPGVISRGYGGNADSYPLDVSDAIGSYMSGDEPYLIRRRTSVPVVVDPDRVRTAKSLLANHQVDLIISDDGLQHYRLKRDVEVLIVDGERGFGNGFCLPAGPLREPISRLQTIDLVLVNGPNSNKSIPLDKKAFNFDVVPTRLINLGSGEDREVDELKGVQLTAIAALGNANRFWATLDRLGYNYRPIEYPDHHALNEDDLSVGDGSFY